MYSADFLIFRRISVTRQFLVSLNSIVYFFPTTRIQKLSGYWYSSKYKKIGWMDLKKVKLNFLTTTKVQYPLKSYEILMKSLFSGKKKKKRENMWKDYLQLLKLEFFANYFCGKSFAHGCKRYWCFRWECCSVD